MCLEALYYDGPRWLVLDGEKIEDQHSFLLLCPKLLAQQAWHFYLIVVSVIQFSESVQCQKASPLPLLWNIVANSLIYAF